MARVSRRVQRVAFRALDFTPLPLQQIASFTVLIRYRSLVVFSLGCSQPPVHTALPNSTTLAVWADRGCHPASRAVPDARHRSLTTSLRFYHVGFSDFARRYCQNHCCFLFHPLLICLSPGGCRVNTFEHGPKHAVLARYRRLLRSSSSPEPIDPSSALRVNRTNPHSVLILRQVHLLQPCYDLYPI